MSGEEPWLEAELGPIGPEEMPVARLVWETHRRCCIPSTHDPACNTLRLLAEDQAQLASAMGAVGRLYMRGVPDAKS